jgi:hypothetical protein
MCNAGAALATGMDACVSSICAADSYCCATYWDDPCVDKVTSICGRSCANHRCSTPTFEPDTWNAPDVVGHNNCYNYATNVRLTHSAEPGRASGEWCDTNVDVSGTCMTPENMVCLATNDGLIPSTASATCPDNRTKIGLFVRRGFPGPEYHWYRQDRDNRWSPKLGGYPASNTVNGQLITNPEAAVSSDYQLGGYFCVCSSSEQGQGHTVID